MRGLSPVASSGGHSSSRRAGLSLSRPLLLRSRGSRRAGSVTVAHGSSGSAACGIFPDQGSNSCPLHWQADSQPLRHQGSPSVSFKKLLSAGGGEVGEKKKKLLSCIRLKCWSIPGFHSWLITFLTIHGYWAVLSPLTFPTTLGKWLSSPELSLSTRPTHAVCYQPQTSLLVCLTVTEFSVCQKQNSSPSPLNLPLLVGSPKLYSIILDSSFPLTFSQLKSPTVLPFKIVLDSPYHCSGSCLNLWNSAPFTVKLSTYEENLAVLLLLFFYLKPFKGARTIYRMKHTRLSVTWSLPPSSASFPATPCLKSYSPIILNSSTGSSSHLTCCLPWGCLCWGSACSPTTPILPPR